MPNSGFDKSSPYNDFSSIRLSLASPEQIKSWSYGEVTSSAIVASIRRSDIGVSSVISAAL